MWYFFNNYVYSVVNPGDVSPPNDTKSQNNYNNMYNFKEIVWFRMVNIYFTAHIIKFVNKTIKSFICTKLIPTFVSKYLSLLITLFVLKYLALHVPWNIIFYFAFTRILLECSRNTWRYLYKGIIVISWLKGELP